MQLLTLTFLPHHAYMMLHRRRSWCFLARRFALWRKLEKYILLHHGREVPGPCRCSCGPLHHNFDISEQSCGWLQVLAMSKWQGVQIQACLAAWLRPQISDEGAWALFRCILLLCMHGKTDAAAVWAVALYMVLARSLTSCKSYHDPMKGKGQ